MYIIHHLRSGDAANSILNVRPVNALEGSQMECQSVALLRCPKFPTVPSIHYKSSYLRLGILLFLFVCVCVLFVFGWVFFLGGGVLTLICLCMSVSIVLKTNVQYCTGIPSLAS